MALLTTDQVLDWVPTAEAHRHKLDDLIAWATELAEQHCDRVFVSAAQLEYHDVDDPRCKCLQLRAYPVAAVTYIKENAQGTSPTTLVATAYTLDSARGLLYRNGAYWYEGKQAVLVSYTGGYSATTLPGGLRRALLQLCAHVLTGRGNVGVASESADGQSQTYLTYLGAVPQDVAAMLAPYRRLGAG